MEIHVKKEPVNVFLFDMNFHEYSMNFQKLSYKPFLFFYLLIIYSTFASMRKRWYSVAYGEKV